MPDVFQIERERLRTAVIPQLVDANYADEWEKRKEYMYKLIEAYNQESLSLAQESKQMELEHDSTEEKKEEE